MPTPPNTINARPPFPDDTVYQGDAFNTISNNYLAAWPAIDQQTYDAALNSYNNAVEAEGFATTATAQAVIAANQATIATEQAAIATAAAGAIAVEFTATSTTSTLIEIASKTFAIETGKAFIVGQAVRIVSDADINNYMIGQITAASDGSITVNVTTIGGSGTFADWSISLVNLSPSDFKTVGGQSIVGVGDIAILRNISVFDTSQNNVLIDSAASKVKVTCTAAGGTTSSNSNNLFGGGAGATIIAVVDASNLSYVDITVGAPATSSTGGSTIVTGYNSLDVELFELNCGGGLLATNPDAADDGIGGEASYTDTGLVVDSIILTNGGNGHIDRGSAGPLGGSSFWGGGSTLRNTARFAVGSGGASTTQAGSGIVVIEEF